VNGLALLQAARSMAHRRLTPIVLLSAQTIEREALDAGASAVLHKPEGVRVLAKTIARFLEGQCSEDKKVSEESSGRPKLD
jgi:CheY-like chemotaxis protein